MKAGRCRITLNDHREEITNGVMLKAVLYVCRAREGKKKVGGLGRALTWALLLHPAPTTKKSLYFDRSRPSTDMRVKPWENPIAHHFDQPATSTVNHQLSTISRQPSTDIIRLTAHP